MDSDFLHELMTEEAATLGYPDVEVSFSLGYCQGDGASFTGRITSERAQAVAEQHMKGKQLAAVKAVYARGEPVVYTITRTDHHYVHWNTTSVSLETCYCQQLSELEEAGLQILNAFLEVDVQEAGQALEAYGYREMEADEEELLCA